MNEHVEEPKEKETENQTEQETESHKDTEIRYRGKECRRVTWIGSMMIRVGDPIEVVVRGRIDNVFQGTFWCFNPDYGWIWIRTNENDVIIKMKDIKYLRKLKR